MTNTLATIRQELGKDLNECHTGTMASPSTTTFIDVELIDEGESDARWVGAWVIVTSGDQAGTVRRVKTYDQDTGLITLSRSWTSPGDATYEMHTLLSPADMQRAINAALAKCLYVTREDITVVASQRQYALTDYDWLTEPAQVRQVEARYGDTAGQYRYRPIDWWAVPSDEGVLTLDVEPQSTATTLVLEAVRTYAALDEDDDATACPLEWVKAGAEMEVFEFLRRRDPAVDASRWNEQKAEAALRFFELSRRYQPRWIPRVQHPLAPHRTSLSTVVY